jgi:hypothetical protein
MIGVILAGVFAKDLSTVTQIAIFSAMLFLCCMTCHGEVYRLKPDPRHVTSYYLMIALGGAAGGAFVAVIAPLIFHTYLELNLGLVACCLFIFLADKTPALHQRRRRWLYIGMIICIGALVAIVQNSPISNTGERAIIRTRNFFGVVTIWEKDAGDPAKHQYSLQHGTTIHGLQFVDPDKRLKPTSYYGPASGVGRAVSALPQAGNRQIGVVGLGVGTLAAYGRVGDTIRFYEINPAIEHLARSFFGYIANSSATVDVVMGDARLSLESQPSQGFDLLVLDAFSSDSVPVHLLTKEAFDVYLRHVQPRGIIAVHVSAIHLDLTSVVMTLADHMKLKATLVEDAGTDVEGTVSSTWVLLSRDERLNNSDTIRAVPGTPQRDRTHADLWTDDRVNLLGVLR